MDIMIDIETLSTKSNALILCIGAIKFNTENIDSFDNLSKFYCLIDIEDSKKYNLDIDDKCIEWWNKQPLKDEIFGTQEYKKLTLKEALLNFNKWYNSDVIINNVWAQGINFDIPILENAYIKTNIKIPWKYWNVRDSRTMCKILNIPPTIEFQDKIHHPLYDCYRQILSIQKVFNILRNKKII